MTLFIDATCNNTNINDGCIECANIVDNGTNSCIFFLKKHLISFLRYLICVVM